MEQQDAAREKPLFWVGTSKKDLRGFPGPVKDVMGYGLYVAQKGDKHPHAKPLKGLHGAGVLEIVDDFDGRTYRAVYTLKMKGAMYVLHAFQKKSKKGKATPKPDVNLIHDRMAQARLHYLEWSKLP